MSICILGDNIIVCSLFTNCSHIIMQAKSIHPVWFWSNHYTSMSLSTQICWKSSKEKTRKNKIKHNVKSWLAWPFFFLNESIITSKKLVLLEKWKAKKPAFPPTKMPWKKSILERIQTKQLKLKKEWQQFFGIHEIRYLWNVTVFN